MLTPQPSPLRQFIALIVLSLLIGSQGLAQPSLSWLRTGYTSSYCRGQAVAAGSDGTTWVAGRFYGSVDFGTTNVTAYNGSTWDGFLAKYAPSGALSWVARIGGNSTDEAQSVAIDAAGNAYTHGFFNGTLYLESTNFSVFAGNDSFVTKHDPQGNLVWALRCGGGGPAAWAGIATDPAQNIYVSGTFNGTGYFANTNIPSIGGYNPFVMKLNPAGEMLWVRTFSGRGNTYGRALATDRQGNVLLSGAFTDTLMADERCVYARGSEDIYVVKLTSDGTVVWLKSFGDTSQESVQAAGFDPSGNAIIAGYFNSTLNFGVTNLSSFGGQECFVAKLGPAGNPLWAKSFQGGSDDLVNSLAVDREGSIHVAGQTYASQLNLGTTNLPPTGSWDAFAAKLSPDGETRWGLRTTSGNNELGLAIATDPAGNVVWTGQFGYQLTLGSTNVSNPSPDGMFVTRWTRDLPVIVSQPSSTTVTEGTTLNLDVAVTGTGPFRYQWYRNGVPIADATTPRLAFFGLTTNASGVYQVEVANYEGAIASTPAAVDVLTIADALDLPSLTWTSGGSASWVNQTNITFDGVDALRSGAITNSQQSWMETQVTGPARLSFQWRISCENGYDFLRVLVNGTEVTNTSGKVEWKPVSLLLGAGVNTVRWSYTKDESESVGQDAGWVDQISVAYAPKILAHPSPLIVTNGTSAAFQVIHDGTPPFQYQWTRNGSPLAQGTNASYTIPAAAPGDEGDYSVTVSNSAGAVTSAAARLTVRVPPTITQQPGSVAVGPGQSVVLQVGTPNPGSFQYQWLRNGIVIPGANTATLTLTNLTPELAGAYTVVVSSTNGSTLSQPAHVTLTSLTMRPTILVAGTPGMNYQIVYAELIKPTNWLVLTNFSLPYSPYHFVDFTAQGRPQRFYRVLAP